MPEASKQKVIQKYQLHGKDTGSPEVQVAVLSQRIASLTEHFKKFVKDHHGRRGLIQLVSQRRSLLNYLRREDEARYRNLIDQLGLRK